MKETLDQPEDKRLFGLDLSINRFRIINPVPGELLIYTDKPKNAKSLWYALFFGAFGGLFIFFLVEDLMRSGGTWDGNNSVMTFFALFFIVPSSLLVYIMFSKKARWHFTATELVQTNDFGRRKKYQRDAIQSVYVDIVINKTNGVYSGTDHWVSIKLKSGKAVSLFHLDTSAGRSTILGEMVRPGEMSTAEEARKICSVISTYWQIPFSV